MSFCSFSKEYNENAYTEVENKFITKYLPEADPFAVKVYLYGLFLCQKSEDFSLTDMAEVLHSTPTAISDAFSLWEDYDLVEIVHKDPLVVNYLPVRSLTGKPKRIRYEQYGDFNKELQRRMQEVGKFVSYNDSIKYMQFLDENEIETGAFLLIAEYCIKKQGDAISPAYIFNKAKKFIKNGLHTYEQVETELSAYNENEATVTAILNAIGIFRKIDENDYACFNGWMANGFSKESVLYTAKYLKKSSVEGLSLLLDELKEKDKTELSDVKEYLSRRDELLSLTFKIAKKLGVRIQNPASYLDCYTEKWVGIGYEETGLLSLASYLFKTDCGDFETMDSTLRQLFKDGIVSEESIGEYMENKNADLKLFLKLQTYLGSLKKSSANLALIETWHGWNFSDEMIIEAGKRSALSLSPVPYMNKILSEWKRENVFSLSAIPEKTVAVNYPTKNDNPIDNEESERERYYAKIREQAEREKDKFVALANRDERFVSINSELSKMEFALAKAELKAPETLPDLQQKKAELVQKRLLVLDELGIASDSLELHFTCQKCMDTGILKDGRKCDCYKRK